jgi:hypothetical protein
MVLGMRSHMKCATCSRVYPSLHSRTGCGRRRKTSITEGPELHQLHKFLLEQVLSSFGIPATSSLPDSQVRHIDAVVRRYWIAYRNDREASTSICFRSPGFPISANLAVIQRTTTHHIEWHWGRCFYGDDLPPGFSTDPRVVNEYVDTLMTVSEDDNDNVIDELEQDIHEGAKWEAYGPPIDPIDFAELVSEANQPRKSNCSICAETFAPRTSGALCLKLESCGHHFHYRRINEWLNGVAANSNLCPECRAQICSDRRPVRVVGASDAEDTDSGDVDPPENHWV